MKARADGIPPGTEVCADGGRGVACGSETVRVRGEGCGGGCNRGAVRMVMPALVCCHETWSLCVSYKRNSRVNSRVCVGICLEP